MFSQLNGSADLAAAVNDVLVAAQLFQPHGATGVELLGGNARLSEKEPVRLQQQERYGLQDGSERILYSP